MGKKFQILEEDKINLRPDPVPASDQDKKFRDVFYGSKPAIAKAEESGNNLGQSSDKVRTNLGQTTDKDRTITPTDPLPHEETSDKVRTQPRTHSRTNLGQSSDKLRTKCGFLELVGAQRQIALFIYEQSHLARGRITEPIAISALALSCGTTVLSAQKTIQRLEEKGIIRRAEYRTGRGGWTKYELPQEVFQEIMQLETSDKLRTNLGQCSDKVRTQPRTQLRTTAASSSLNIYNKETTTEETEDNQNELIPVSGKFQLKPEWEVVDIEPLAFIGFSKHHLIQIIRQGLVTPDLVQDSINAFAFDLQKNERGKGINSPIHYFMGILRKGQPYTPPDNYVSPKEQAIRKILEMRKREEEVEKELQEAEFRKWLRETPEDDKKRIAGDTFGLSYSETNQMILAKLRGEFLEKIYKKTGNKINIQDGAL